MDTTLSLFVVLGLIPATIASRKGRSFLLWWFYGTTFFLIALIHALKITPRHEVIDDQSIRDDDKKCTHCSEYNRNKAIVCRFCGTDLEP